MPSLCPIQSHISVRTSLLRKSTAVELVEWSRYGGITVGSLPLMQMLHILSVGMFSTVHSEQIHLKGQNSA